MTSFQVHDLSFVQYLYSQQEQSPHSIALLNMWSIIFLRPACFSSSMVLSMLLQVLSSAFSSTGDNTWIAHISVQKQFPMKNVQVTWALSLSAWGNCHDWTWLCHSCSAPSHSYTLPGTGKSCRHKILQILNALFRYVSVLDFMDLACLLALSPPSPLWLRLEERAEAWIRWLLLLSWGWPPKIVCQTGRCPHLPLDFCWECWKFPWCYWWWSGIRQVYTWKKKLLVNNWKLFNEKIDRSHRSFS